METLDLNIQQMKPGILIAEDVTSRGGVRYRRRDVESYLEGPTRKRKFETDVTIDDEEEFNEVRRLKSTAYAAIRKVCANTPVGLICPVGGKQELMQTIEEIKQQTQQFNSTAQTTRLVTRYAFFAVEENNQETLAAITDQVADISRRVEESITASDLEALRKAPKRLLGGMTPEKVLDAEQSVKNSIIARVRAELIRSAISEAKGLDSLLPDNASSEVRKVIREARKIARKVIRDVTKRDHAVNEVLREVDLSGVRRLRAAFVLASTKADQRAQEAIEFDGYVPARRLDPGEETLVEG